MIGMIVYIFTEGKGKKKGIEKKKKENRNDQ